MKFNTIRWSGLDNSRPNAVFKIEDENGIALYDAGHLRNIVCDSFSTPISLEEAKKIQAGVDIATLLADRIRTDESDSNITIITGPIIVNHGEHHAVAATPPHSPPNIIREYRPAIGGISPSNSETTAVNNA